jgi:ATP-dependent DNA helicase RecQ
MGGRYPSGEDLRAVYDALRSVAAEEPAALARVQEAAPRVAKSKVRVVLSLMKELGIVREQRGARFSLKREVDSTEDLGRMAKEWQQRSEADREKLERMEAYARSARCRWRVLHDYFGQEMPDRLCGECDNCRKGLARRAEP